MHGRPISPDKFTICSETLNKRGKKEGLIALLCFEGIKF
jgi:hypothetical protein